MWFWYLRLISLIEYLKCKTVSNHTLFTELFLSRNEYRSSLLYLVLHPCHYTFVSPWTVETKLRSPQNMDGCGNFSILNKNKFPISEDRRVYSIEVAWIQNFELGKYHAETHPIRIEQFLLVLLVPSSFISKLASSLRFDIVDRIAMMFIIMVIIIINHYATI